MGRGIDAQINFFNLIMNGRITKKIKIKLNEKEPHDKMHIFCSTHDSIQLLSYTQSIFLQEQPKYFYKPTYLHDHVGVYM